MTFLTRTALGAANHLGPDSKRAPRAMRISAAAVATIDDVPGEPGLCDVMLFSGAVVRIVQTPEDFEASVDAELGR